MREFDSDRVPDRILKATPTSVPRLPDRYAACLLLKDLNYDQQLYAINGMLNRHR